MNIPERQLGQANDELVDGDSPATLAIVERAVRFALVPETQ
jgi:hypothetical protein